MEVTSPASKTDPFRKGITLTISASEDDACPVKAMRQFLAVDTHRAADSPLFCMGQLEQQAFTREFVVKRLQQLARTAGLGQGTWNGNGFRSGAATWAARVGISEAEFKGSAAGDLMLIRPSLSTLTGNKSHYLGASRPRKPQPASHRCEPASIWVGGVTHRMAGQFKL